MVEVLAKDQFVDALPDEDMRLHIRQNKPTTLRDTLSLALELESYQIASRQRTKLVRGKRGDTRDVSARSCRMHSTLPPVRKTGTSQVCGAKLG